ncbi:cell division protein FtsB [Pedobacter africanus]|uniref:Cell division protein FtsB n=1 Tax=Pedobacter africanus TaxID=151894 RepID=A0ACC6KRE1_9SPHI|nr:hypothetical protein [Pedobacter africanus]MDR6781918.1 cell division protein FtsB [Pedobacter africanus]
MFDLNSLFAGNDNLFKFLFVGGVMMVLFAFVYPLQKKQSLELEINAFNKEVSLLNKEINDVEKQCHDANKSDSLTILGIKRLQRQREISKTPAVKEQLTKQINKLKDEASSIPNGLEAKVQNIQIKKIILDFNKGRIKILQGHASQFRWYEIVLIVVGSTFAAVGLFFWALSCRNTERLKIKEINKP